MEEIGCKCQTFFISLLSSRRKQKTSVRFFFLLHTKLKGDFSMKMFFLSCANETMYVLWNLPFFKMVPPKTNFFSFLKTWADNSSTNQYSYELFYGWGMAHLAVLAPMLWERGLVEPAALSCVSCLINGFLTGVKQLVKDQRGHSPSPSDVCVGRVLCPFSYFNKTLLHKSSWVIKPGPWLRS